MKLALFAGLAAFAAIGLGESEGRAEIIGGVEFPQGLISFADEFVSYKPNPASIPGANYQGAFNALGAPNYSGANTCASQAACTFVSLGAGGTLIVKFTDNVLTGSGNSDDDLWIFEIGPDVEDTLVDVSVDGLTWQSVGFVTGSTRGIDIDAFGFDQSYAFTYVRLIDVYGEGATGMGGTVGADIDAVGAISTRSVIIPGVPEPGTWAMMLAGFGLTGFAARRRAGMLPATVAA